MQVDAAEEEEAFADVATAALNILLLGLETKLDACLGSLMRANWASVESVRNSIWSCTINSTKKSSIELLPRLLPVIIFYNFIY